jgi:F420-non-reducing hydrogenase small subunit
MPDKPKVAFYWCASCGGCEEAVVDLATDILKVVEAVDIVLWPVALDFKRRDIEAMADGSIAVAFINGAVRNSEQEEWVHLLRKKSGLLVAVGACAHMGGIPGLANFNNRAEIFETVYGTLPIVDNAARAVPLESVVAGGETLTLPAFWDTVKSLGQVVDVDYYLPGCAPTADSFLAAVGAILKGDLPPRGAVLAPNMACCESCPRKDSKPDKIEIKEIKRITTSIPDPTKCFLAEGYICMGPATRSGCGNRCIEGNMPCRGCMGPMDGIEDQGAKFISAFASVLAPKDDASIEAILDTIPDPAGTFYRFSLPTSLLRRKNMGGPA